MIKIKSLKFLPEVQPGYKRSYVKCKTCGRVAYRDYVPFSLSNPIITQPCGHGIAERNPYATIGEQEGMRAILERRELMMKGKRA